MQLTLVDPRHVTHSCQSTNIGTENVAAAETFISDPQLNLQHSQHMAGDGEEHQIIEVILYLLFELFLNNRITCMLKESP